MKRGALHSLLEAISGAGASIVTINQSTPESGTARVSVSFRTGGMHLSAEALLAELRRSPRWWTSGAVYERWLKGECRQWRRWLFWALAPVGSGVWEILSKNADVCARRAGVPVEVGYICDIRDFSGHEAAGLFVNNIEPICRIRP